MGDWQIKMFCPHAFQLETFKYSELQSLTPVEYSGKNHLSKYCRFHGSISTLKVDHEVFLNQDKICLAGESRKDIILYYKYSKAIPKQG